MSTPRNSPELRARPKASTIMVLAFGVPLRICGNLLFQLKERVHMTEQIAESHTYRVGHITFIVTPVYPNRKSETIFDILLKLMKADVERL